MNIRKFIRESIERVMMQESDGQAIIGADILNYFPFDKLPEDRQQVNWKSRGVKGWGEIHVPAIDGNGLTTMFGKDDVVDYLQKFIAKYKEEPTFVINSSEPWFNKIKVVNPKYSEEQNALTNAISQFGTEGD